MAFKLHAILTLGRISNLPTVWTNCCAAWVLNRLGRDSPFFDLPPEGASDQLSFSLSQWLWILLGASLLYVAGTTLNDAFDEEYDREHNKERPIPTGVLKPWEVWSIGFAELFGGATILYLKAEVSPVYLAMLCVTILAYDAVHKKWAGSVLLMGGCRLFLWWTIATAGTLISNELSPLVYVWSIALLLYIVGITFVARGEATGSLSSVPWPYILLFVQVILGLFFCFYGARWLVLPIIAILGWGNLHGRMLRPAQRSWYWQGGCSMACTHHHWGCCRGVSCGTCMGFGPCGGVANQPLDAKKVCCDVRLNNSNIQRAMPVWSEISNNSSTTGWINGMPSLDRIASASRSGSPGTSGPSVPGAGVQPLSTPI